MSDNTTDKTTTRRNFLRATMVGAAALPAAGALLQSRPAAAGDMERLSEDDDAARALGYVHDVADVDTDRWSNYEEGQLCSNCQLIGGDADEQWRPCDIFPNKLVNNDGWCSAWVPKS